MAEKTIVIGVSLPTDDKVLKLPEPKAENSKNAVSLVSTLVSTEQEKQENVLNFAKKT